MNNNLRVICSTYKPECLEYWKIWYSSTCLTWKLQGKISFFGEYSTLTIWPLLEKRSPGSFLARYLQVSRWKLDPLHFRERHSNLAILAVLLVQWVKIAIMWRTVTRVSMNIKMGVRQENVGNRATLPTISRKRDWSL